jgi:hypothetical protein
MPKACRTSEVVAQSKTSEVLSTYAPNSPEHRLPGSCALCYQVDDKGAEIGLLLGIAPRRGDSGKRGLGEAVE